MRNRLLLSGQRNLRLSFGSRNVRAVYCGIRRARARVDYRAACVKAHKNGTTKGRRLNPDGALISQTAYPLWKANARGVDLNCNFDADWGSGRLNTKIRGGENCMGDYPFSEAEASALRDFTLRIRPYVTLSFHTKGEEIYWEYGGKGDKNGAELLEKITGYTAKRIYGSAGGYKDWCIQKLNIPAYTIECGSDSLAHPIKKLGELKKCYKLLKIFIENYGKQA